MTKDDYNLIKKDLHYLEKAVQTKSFIDEDGTLTMRIQKVCKNNALPFCRGCQKTFFTNLQNLLQLVKKFKKK